LEVIDILLEAGVVVGERVDDFGQSAMRINLVVDRNLNLPGRQPNSLPIIRLRLETMRAKLKAKV
jgi:hypothetical protein